MMSHQCNYSLFDILDVSNTCQQLLKIPASTPQNKYSVFLDGLDNFQQWEISMVQHIAWQLLETLFA